MDAFSTCLCPSFPNHKDRYYYPHFTGEETEAHSASSRPYISSTELMAQMT